MRSNELVLTLIVTTLVACGPSCSLPTSPTSKPPTTGTASTTRQDAATPLPTRLTGSITGHLSYPSDFLPPQAVYALNTTDESRFYLVETVRGQNQYTLLGVPTGDYFVLASPRSLAPSPNKRFPAGYTKAVACGLANACSDHTLIPVHVAADGITSSIDPDDWYGGQDVFPVIPGALPAPAADVSPSPSSDALQVAIYLAQQVTKGRYVQNGGSCPANVACVRLNAEHDGHAAAYFDGSAGSNGELQACAFYLVKVDTAWRALTFSCRKASTAFPTLGASGRVLLGIGEDGCINVHVTPGLTTKVIACLPSSTVVVIDDGPYYLPEATALPAPSPDVLNLWWHVSGQGWLVHRYLGQG